MKILLDESVPVQVRRALPDHVVLTVSEIGWSGRENGELLSLAEQARFDVFVLADKNLRYQQNLSTRQIALVELWTNHRPTLERHFPSIASTITKSTPGSYQIVQPT